MENFLSVQTLITLLVTFLVTAGIKSLSDVLGKDLSGYGAVWTAGGVAILISLFQSFILPAVPAEYVPMIEQIATIIVGLLGAMGVHRTVKALR